MNHITTSIRLDLAQVSADEDALLHQRLMRPQQAALRFAYNRLLEGAESKVIWNTLRAMFPLLTGRNLNDAILSARAIIKSQRQRLPEQAQSLSARIRQAEDKLERELHRQAGPRPERVSAMRRRIRRLLAEREAAQAHLDGDTVPPAIFGGRKLWQQAQRSLPGARAEWRKRRSDEFLSRGARNYRGNPHCRLLIGEDGRIRLTVRVPVAPLQRRGRTTTTANWLTFDVNYSRQYDPLLRQAAIDGAAGKSQYTVRLLRLSPGQYRAYITLSEPVTHREYAVGEPLPEWCVRVGGVDLNLDHLAVAITDREGQFRARQVFRFPNLGELPRNTSRWQIGNIARDVVAWLQSNGAQALVIEDLNISNDGGHFAHFHRRTVPFAYRQLAEALVRRALRAGLAVRRVNPAYTSWIGQLKYARQYGISVHVAAAHVIARRGLGLQERIPQSLVHKFPALVETLKAEIEQLERSHSGHGGDEREPNQQLERCREWMRRLVEWKSCSPEAGKPWLLWATLYAVSRQVSGARAVLE